MDIDSLDSFTRQYIETALWAENDNSDPSGGEPLDKNYSIEDIDEDDIKKMIADAQKFQHDNAKLLNKAYELYHVTDGSNPQSYAGHDFWLTRTGHGTGFWDRDELEANNIGEKLTKASEKFKAQNLYVGDDNKIYIL